MDMELDFDHLYHKRPPSQHVPKRMTKKQKKLTQKKRKKIKKKKAPKQWDSSRSDLAVHKLSHTKQLEKRLSTVSKHRHYAKDLVAEQKRKHLEKKRLKQEEKSIEFEQKQLIRRRQQLMRRQPVPNLRRAFPQFTAGRDDYDDTSSDNTEEDDDDDAFQSDESEKDYANDAIADSNKHKTEETLHALTAKLCSLETELETMKLVHNNTETNEEDQYVKNANDRNVAKNVNETQQDLTNDEGNITLDMDGINKTLNAVKAKQASKTLHLKLPSMPSIAQPPQLNENNERNISDIPPPKSEKTQDENKSINTALHSLDVPSLLMLLDKLKMYFKEIQNEKKQNEEFRSTLLESVNAQNTQILHLLAQLASQQKEMDHLKETVASLTVKVDEHEASHMNAVTKKNSEPKWTNSVPNTMNNEHEIALQDIKNVIEESRPNGYKTNKMLTNTDWKSISNVLVPKTESFEYGQAQQPYTVKKHQRSFLPMQPVQTMAVQQPQEQIQRHMPPQPIPKPNKNKKAAYIKPNNPQFIEIEHNVPSNNAHSYPAIRVERFHQ